MPWCVVCCTRHRSAKDCPGNLLATGPERHARKFAVSQNKRLEFYGVLIAEAGEVWRARIFTYPNMLWSVPGGRGTVKFCGASATEAEAKAIEFLEEHCTRRRYTMVEAADDLSPGRVGAEDASEKNPQGGKEERHPCKVPVRFGVDKATQAATTANLSVGGIYVATDKPAPKGTRLRILLNVQAYTIPLIGVVAWVRPNEEPGKPKGMGVQVESPPALYQRYVGEVQEAMAKRAAEATPS
jgi:uncharacterized protein (TIGR02266 family)